MVAAAAKKKVAEDEQQEEARVKAASEAVANPPCAFCGKSSFETCTNCMNTHYCSRAFQVVHWAVHKIPCKSAPINLTKNLELAALKKKLAEREEALGVDHEETLYTVNEIGLHLKGHGKLKEAEVFYRRALEGYERTLGRDRLHLLLHFFIFGSLYPSQSAGGRVNANDIRQLPHTAARKGRHFHVALFGCSRRCFGESHTSYLSRPSSRASTLCSPIGFSETLKPSADPVCARCVRPFAKPLKGGKERNKNPVTDIERWQFKKVLHKASHGTLAAVWLLLIYLRTYDSHEDMMTHKTPILNNSTPGAGSSAASSSLLCRRLRLNDPLLPYFMLIWNGFSC